MTDDELRAALRSLRIGTPGEWPFRYAPAVVIVAALLVPPLDALDAFGLAGCLVAFVWVGLSQWERLHHDRVASRHELVETLREILVERLNWDRTQYPVLAFVILVLAAGLAGMAAYAVASLGKGRIDMLPLGVAIPVVGLSQAAGLVYHHRARVPEYRRLFEALTAPEPTAAAGEPVGTPRSAA